jgi:hypothetical protein
MSSTEIESRSPGTNDRSVLDSSAIDDRTNPGFVDIDVLIEQQLDLGTATEVDAHRDATAGDHRTDARQDQQRGDNGANLPPTNEVDRRAGGNDFERHVVLLN